jgi:GNAT superfamily N-acetyltransferase
MSVTVTSVRSPSDLKAFVDLPYRLHAGTPWVPPLKLERYAFLSRRLNAFFTHGKAVYLLARRGDEVVGRVTAQVDHAFQRFHGNRWGMFGFIELIDDEEVASALVTAAELWLKRQGCDTMIGPMDFSMNDESGVLFEGHDLHPIIKQPWHPPYYQRHLEAIGLEKARDLFSYYLDVSDRGNVNPFLFEIAKAAREQHGVTIRNMTRRHLRRDMDVFQEVYNAAWRKNWGFVPYSKADLDAYAQELQLVFSPGWFMVAEIEGKPVAMAISVLDINATLKKMRGRLLPFGWWHYLRRFHNTDTVRVGFLGVLPDYQMTGVAAALYERHYDMAESTRQTKGEAGWILEDNKGMNRGLEAMGGEITKRYRVYTTAL